MKKPRGLKVRLYSDHMIYLNNSFDVFPRTNSSENICMTELSEILSNIMPNSSSKPTYVPGFYCGYISFKAAVNMFELM